MSLILNSGRTKSAEKIAHWKREILHHHQRREAYTNVVHELVLMKRGARPKTLPGTSGSLGEANTAVAERLADWQQNLSDQVWTVWYFSMCLLQMGELINYIKSHLSSLVGKTPKGGHGQMQSSGKGKAGYQMISSKGEKILKQHLRYFFFFFWRNHHAFAMRWERDD